MCVGTCASYIFVCGQWLSLEKGHSIVEKNYESGEIRVGAFLENPKIPNSKLLEDKHRTQLEAVCLSESDVRISLFMEQPEIRKHPILYRYYVVTSILLHFPIISHENIALTLSAT